MTTARDYEYIARILNKFGVDSTGNAYLDLQVVHVAFNNFMAVYKNEPRTMWGFIERFYDSEEFMLPEPWITRFCIYDLYESNTIGITVREIESIVVDTLQLLRAMRGVGIITVHNHCHEHIVAHSVPLSG